VDFGAVEYFVFVTRPFSTVLPAILSTRELLLSCPRIDRSFRDWEPLSSGMPATCRSGYCAPESGPSSSDSSAWNRKRFPFHNACDKIGSRREPPSIPTSQEGVR